MIDKTHILEAVQPKKPHWLLVHYRSTPLYLRILIAMGIGILIGLWLGKGAEPLKWVSTIVLRVLGALAPALILVAVMDSILNAQIKGRGAARLAFLLLLNTTVAISLDSQLQIFCSPAGTVSRLPRPLPMSRRR